MIMRHPSGRKRLLRLVVPVTVALLAWPGWSAGQEKEKPVGPDDPRVKVLKRRFVMKRLNAVEKELLQVQSERRRAQVEVALLEAEIEEGKKAMIEERVKDDALVQEYHEKVEKLRNDLRETRQVLGEKARDNAVVDRLEENLHRAQVELEARQNEVRPSMVELVRKKGGKKEESKLTELQKRLKSTGLLEAALNKEADRLRIEAVQMEEDAKKDAKPKAKENDS